MINRYERPAVETMKADEIVELLGPVSCGSSAPAPGGFVGQKSASGNGNAFFNVR